MVDVRDHVAETNHDLSITLFVGKVCLTLIFFMNAFGVIDQSMAGGLLAVAAL